MSSEILDTSLPPANRLLGLLPSPALDALATSFERVQLASKDVLAESGVAFEHIYFPEGGVISVVHYMDNGDAVEVGTIGTEGLVGLAELLSAAPAVGKTFVQVPGSALRIRVPHLLQACDAHPAMERVFMRYAHTYMMQVAQGAACNRLHGIEQRCAKWLLMTHDRMGGASVMPLKHEFLALMLGVRRAGVSLAAGALQDAGLIRYRRGAIQILDRAALERKSCECYEVTRRSYNRLFASAADTRA